MLALKNNNKDKHIPVAKFKAEFSSILSRVQNGEEFIIEYGRNHKQVAKIVPIEIEKPKDREFGFLKDKNFYIADDFNDENEEINDMFYNSKLDI
jgi:antitoxin (DNA-binding transcriptional repressor) of toxin-antitoxin stability system